MSSSSTDILPVSLISVQPDMAEANREIQQKICMILFMYNRGCFARTYYYDCYMYKHPLQHVLKYMMYG